MSNKLHIKLKLHPSSTVANNKVVHVIGEDLGTMKSKGCSCFKVKSGEFVTLDGTLIEDFETLTEISKLEEIFLLTTENFNIALELDVPSPSSLAHDAARKCRSTNTDTASVTFNRDGTGLDDNSCSDVANVAPSELGNVSTQNWWERIDDNKFFQVIDIVRETRATIKSESADELIASVKNVDVANEHQFQLFLNACGTHLMNHCERKYYPTSKEFTRMAQSLVYFVPALANKKSSRPWDIFYDDFTSKGYLESYIRSKRWRLGLSKPRNCNVRKSAEDLQPANVSVEQNEADEVYMRVNTVTEENRERHLSKFRSSRQARRSFIANKKNSATLILNKYPRLQDMDEAILDEFKFLTQGDFSKFLANWQKVEVSIVNYSKGIRNRVSIEPVLQRLEKAREDFDVFKATLCCIELCINLFPNVSAKAKKRGVILAKDAMKFLFHEVAEVTLPGRIVEDLPHMQQPGIVKINEQYFLKIEAIMIKLPESITLLHEALAYLVMFHHNLALHYCDSLKLFFSFCELLFEMKPTVDSPRLRRIHGALVY